MKKEIYLHQAQFLMAGALVLLHLGVLLARHYAPSLAVRYEVLDVIYKGFWVLWLVMPFLVGCGAIAEERRVGTLESQLCLPIRRRTQFFVKFTTALGIAMLVGALLPYLFEGNRILPELKFGNDEQFSEANIARVIKLAESNWVVVWIRLAVFVREILPVLALVGSAALSVSAAFYASSNARNTLQALAPGVLGFIAGVFFLLTAHSPEAAFGYALWCGPLIYLIGLPVLVVTLAWLTHWNFKCVNTGWIVWRRNVFTLLGAAAVVMIVTTGIYQRVWEFLTPIEPAHGPAMFTKGRPVKSFYASNSKVVTELPDGRTRFDYFAPYASGLWSMLTHGYKLQHLANRSRIEFGSNWLGIVDCYYDQAWLRNDGSLWVPEKTELGMFTRTAPVTPAPLVRKGQDNDWKQIANLDGGSILLLKTNGSLWQLGDKFGKGWETNWPGLIGSTPKRLGTNSDWGELFSIQQQPCLRKQDGSLWSTQPNGSTEISSEPMIVSDRLKLYPALHLGDGKWHDVGWINVPRLASMLVGVHEGGEFRSVAGWETGPKKKNFFVLAAKQERIGNQTNWVSLAGDADNVITLRADGTLWRWKFLEDTTQHPDSSVVTRLGFNSDWVGIVNCYDGLLALAADGGVWHWQFEPLRSRYMSSNLEGIFRPLLRHSRKPQLVCNIFAKAE